MERIVFNDDNLVQSDINESVFKSRAIIVNDNGEILLCKYADMYFLPGGKIDDERFMCSGLEVEIKEETGINVELNQQTPFLLVQQYIKHYSKRDNQSFINRISETFYFIIYTNEEVNEEQMALTESEKQGGFSTLRIHPNAIEELLSRHLTTNPRNDFFTRELLVVLKKYQDTINKGIAKKLTL